MRKDTTMKKNNGSSSQRKRYPPLDWEADPRIRAFAISIGPAAAKAVRRIRDGWNDHWPKDSEDEGITDKGVLYKAISVGLNMLARRHLHDPRMWKAGGGIWDEAEVAGLYVPVFRRYAEDAQLELEEARAAAEREAARTPPSVRQAANVIQLFAQEPK